MIVRVKKLSDKEPVGELRKRGYEVKCSKIVTTTTEI